MADVFDTIRKFFNKEPPKKGKYDQDLIPPGADIYGIGPNFIADSERSPITQAGDPFAPTMGVSRGGTQPTHQEVINSQEFGDSKAPAGVSNQQWWRSKDADDRTRHSAQERDTNGWETPVNDRVTFVGATRVPPDRWTASAHPELDSTVVPSQVNAFEPRQFNGSHFSLADHRRDYEIYGMAPQRSRRNTYRLEATPWDADIVDTPAQDQIPIPNEQEIPATPFGSIIGNRNYRLGG